MVCFEIMIKSESLKQKKANLCKKLAFKYVSFVSVI